IVGPKGSRNPTSKTCANRLREDRLMSSKGSEANSIESVLQESRHFAPSDDFRASAHVKSTQEYERLWNYAKDDPESFWAERADEHLTWFQKWDKVLDWNPPFAKWFVGGKLNA